MTPRFRSLFSHYAGLGMARQLALADVIEDRNWAVDLKQCQARFGNDLRFSIQLLGTQSESSGNWMWSWANKQSNLSPEITQYATTLKAWGDQHQIPEFSDEIVSGDDADGHMLSTLVSGMHGKCCYYRGPYDGGALFFLIVDPPESVTRPSALVRIPTVIMQTISTWELEHRVAAESYLKAEGFQLQNRGTDCLAQRGKEELTVKFDDLNRITGLNTTLGDSK